MSVFKAKHPKILKIVSLLVFVMTASSALAMPTGGNGGGHNGPDLAGTSIPVSVDRQITYKDLSGAINSCSKEVVKDLLAQGLESLTYALSHELTDSWVSKLESGFGYTVNLEIPFQYHPDHSGQVYLSFGFGESKYVSGMNADAWGIVFYPIMLPNPHSLAFNLEEPLPLFTFDKEITDSSYDEFGRLIKGGELLTNLRIVYPKNYGSAVPLFNSETKRKTSLVINEEKFVNCISSKIQDSTGN